VLGSGEVTDPQHALLRIDGFPLSLRAVHSPEQGGEIFGVDDRHRAVPAWRLRTATPAVGLPLSPGFRILTSRSRSARSRACVHLGLRRVLVCGRNITNSIPGNAVLPASPVGPLVEPHAVFASIIHLDNWFCRSSVVISDCAGKFLYHHTRFAIADQRHVR
jgi:hypothetical protein